MPRSKPTNIDRLIGKLIKRYRLKAGYTSNYPIAKLLKETPAAVSHQVLEMYEAGKTKAPISTLYELAKIYKVEVVQFLPRTEK